MDNNEALALTHVIVGKVILKEAQQGNKVHTIEQFTKVLVIVGATMESLNDLGYRLVKQDGMV
jgi:hypothetical protein